MAASVWMRWRSAEPDWLAASATEMVRSRPLTMPSVTEPGNSPSGLPIAMAVCPTWTAEESPSVAAGSPVASTFTIAKSVRVSTPFTVPSNWRPSARITVTVLAVLTTWWLVRIQPSELMMMPEPVPETWPPSGELLPDVDEPPIWMVTTAGPTFAATWIVVDSWLPAAAELDVADGVVTAAALSAFGVVLDPVVAWVLPVTATVPSAAAAPLTPEMRHIAATSMTLGLARRRRVGITGAVSTTVSVVGPSQKTGHGSAAGATGQSAWAAVGSAAGATGQSAWAAVGAAADAARGAAIGSAGRWYQWDGGVGSVGSGEAMVGSNSGRSTGYTMTSRERA